MISSLTVPKEAKTILADVDAPWHYNFNRHMNGNKRDDPAETLTLLRLLQKLW
jgi:hypothetical protein